MCSAAANDDDASLPVIPANSTAGGTGAAAGALGVPGTAGPMTFGAARGLLGRTTKGPVMLQDSLAFSGFSVIDLDAAWWFGDG